MAVIDSIKKSLGIKNKETKWLNADGTPKTVTSARSTLGISGIGTTKRSEKSLKEYWNYYSNDGTVFSSINTIAWNTVMVGYHLTSESDEAKKLIQSKFDEMDLDGILLDNVIYALVYGDTFIEKVKSRHNSQKKAMQDAEPKKPKGYISYLKTVDPITMIINTDKYGNEESYQQKIQGQIQKTKLTPEDIIHLKFFPQSNSPYGISLIGPSQTTIDRMIGVDKALYSATIRHGTPKFLTTIGTPEDLPPKAVYDKIKSDLEDITYNNEFTVPGGVTIETIDERGVPGVEEYSSIFQKKTIVGLMCPEESLGMATRGTSEATAKVREIMFERFIQAIQHKLSTRLRVELINPILLENGHEENSVIMKFRSITTADEEGFAKWYGNLLRGFQFTQQKPVTINEIRDSFHLPPIEGGDDITWGGQVSNVGGGGGAGNTEGEETEKPKPGPSPQATSD